MEGNLNYGIIGENFTLTNPLTMANRWYGLPHNKSNYFQGLRLFIRFSTICLPFTYSGTKLLHAILRN